MPRKWLTFGILYKIQKKTIMIQSPSRISQHTDKPEPFSILGEPSMDSMKHLFILSAPLFTAFLLELVTDLKTSS